MAKSTLLRQYVQDYYKETANVRDDYDKDYATYLAGIDKYNKDAAWFNQWAKFSPGGGTGAGVSAAEIRDWYEHGQPIVDVKNPPRPPTAPTPESPAWRTPLTQENIKEVEKPHTDLAETQLASAKSMSSNPTPTAQATESESLQSLEKLRSDTGTQGILQKVLSGELEQTGTNRPTTASIGTSTALKGIEL
jgi:hypothetical protein